MNPDRYATDGVQDVALTGAPTGGTFTLSFGGYTTRGWRTTRARADGFQAALEGLTSIGSGNVVVTAAVGLGLGSAVHGHAGSTVPDRVTANGAGLTGGTSPGCGGGDRERGGDKGMVAEMTDTAGRVSRTYSDAAGRTTRRCRTSSMG